MDSILTNVHLNEDDLERALMAHYTTNMTHVFSMGAESVGDFLRVNVGGHVSGFYVHSTETSVNGPVLILLFESASADGAPNRALVVDVGTGTGSDKWVARQICYTIGADEPVRIAAFS